MRTRTEARPDRIATPCRRSRRALLASVSALLLGVAAHAGAQSTSVNGKIAYESCGPSNLGFGQEIQCDIWVMDPDGTNQVNLTNSLDRNEIVPAWAPGGTRIAYLDGFTYPTTLMLMDADGGNKTPVISVDSMAPMSWSPDGTQIAMSLGGSIGIVDLATGTQTIISRPVSFGGVELMVTEFEPAWSPDGGKIAFTGIRPERFLNLNGEIDEGAQYEIVVVNPDGSGAQIVSAGDPNSDRASYLEEDRSPAWSPDGSQLVFMSQSQAPSCCGPWQIWVVNRDGTGATNITNDDTINDQFPSWSPDGTQIVFSRADFGGTDLYAMPAPGVQPAAAALASAQLAAAGAATRLTVGANATNPDWGRAPESGGNVRYTLTVDVMGTGKGAGGTVRSLPSGINCGRDCTEAYAANSVLVLTAKPKKGSGFGGWAGACSGTSPTCAVTMNATQSVTATFQRAK